MKLTRFRAFRDDHSLIRFFPAVGIVRALVAIGIIMASQVSPVAGADTDMAAIEKAKTKRYTSISIRDFQDSIHHYQMGLESVDYPRYEPDQIVHIAEILLAYQTRDGGWPKNIDWCRVVPATEWDVLPHGVTGSGGTLDNRNTWPQITYLAHVYRQTKMARYRAACERAIDYIIREQRETGGWRGADVDAITFNDDVTIGVLTTVGQTARKDTPFRFLDDARLKKAETAYLKGIECILRCQITVNGRLTAWCQQHAHDDYRPVDARSYELASICTQESVGIIRFLMDIDKPSPEIRAAIHGAVAWFDDVKIPGIRVDEIPTEPVVFTHHISRMDRIVVEDPSAPPIWTRFYDLENSKPFFCNRDGIVVYSLAEVKRERRTGYGWYGYYATSLLANDYPAWQKKWDPDNSVLESD
jgi:PelA/Pel-15E family pectate lyase